MKIIIAIALVLLSWFVYTKVSGPVTPKSEITSGISTEIVGATVAVSPTVSSPVPSLSGAEAARRYFELIGAGKIPEAIAMMDSTLVPNDTVKQAYGVTYNAFQSVVVAAVTPQWQEEWKDGEEEYRVDLTIQVKPGADAGLWQSGKETRWVVVKKVDTMYRIIEIATGP